MDRRVFNHVAHPSQTIQFEKAWMSSVERKAIKGVMYPALIPSRFGSVVEGRLIGPLVEADLFFLDIFEGAQYMRISSWARQANGELVACEVYMYRSLYHHRLHNRPWDMDNLSEANIQKFFKTYEGFGALIS